MHKFAKFTIIFCNNGIRQGPLNSQDSIAGIQHCAWVVSLEICGKDVVPWKVTLDLVLFGTFFEVLVEIGGGCTCVGEDGIDDHVGRGVEVATGTLHVSKDAVVALHECLRGGPLTTSRPGDGIEVREPRYRDGYRSLDKRQSQGLGNPVAGLQRGQYPAGEPRDSRRWTSGVRRPQPRELKHV